MKFNPMSGRETPRGHRLPLTREVLRRQSQRARDNFRLYSTIEDAGISRGASVKAPALGQWHTVRWWRSVITYRIGSRSSTSTTVIAIPNQAAWGFWNEGPDYHGRSNDPDDSCVTGGASHAVGEADRKIEGAPP